MAVYDRIDSFQEWTVACRRELHARPEISLREFETAALIEAKLDEIGIEHRRVGETGVLGILRGSGAGGGRVIALRSDIDALAIADRKDVPYRSKREGVMHACGHDAHTAGLLAAARALKAAEGGFSGEIRLLFQQAEEIGAGARQFIEAGALEGVEQVFGVHVMSQLPTGVIASVPGPVAASCDYFKITVHGKSGHASTPEKCVDALYIASQIVVSLQAIVSRQTAAVEPVVVGVGTVHGGDAYNIVAQNAVLEGTTRTFSHEVRKATNDKVAEIARGVAALYRGAAEVEFKDFAPPLVNEETAAALGARVAAGIVGEENVITRQPKMLGADDFAELLLQAPGVYLKVGTQDPGNPDTAQAHHHERFDIDEKALSIIAKAYAGYALTYLGAPL